MRWQALFADLEAQAAALDAADLASEVADRTRRETALLPLVARLRPAQGHSLALTVEGSGALGGQLLDMGPGWLLLDAAESGEVLVPMSAVLTVSGLGRWAEDDTSEVARRLDLRWALRQLARSRSAVRLTTRDGAVISGTVDRVGADHLDLATHATGVPRRVREVRQVITIPLAALGTLRPE